MSTAIKKEWKMEDLWISIAPMKKRPPLYPLSIYCQNPYGSRKIEGIAFLKKECQLSSNLGTKVQFLL